MNRRGTKPRQVNKGITMLKIVLILWCVVLAGCQMQPMPAAAPVQPVTAGPDPLATLNSRFDDNDTRFDQLEQRITLVQEQIMRIQQQSQALDQRSQQELLALQRLQLSLSQLLTDQTASEADPLAELGYRLEQSLTELEQIKSTLSAQGAAVPAETGFRMVSAYSAKKDWILFRYEESSGQTWRVLNGKWVEVADRTPPPTSRYDVVLQAAAGDIKGYVAARIDRLTGQSWWLNDTRWESF